METSKKATEDGWRELLNEQRQHPGACQVTLAQFDTEYELVYPTTDIADVPEFILQPRGMTALLDAAGRFITQIGEQLSALPEDRRPGNVICMIMTDGMENSSHEWTWDSVKKLITQQQDEWNWKFIFLGANIDAVEIGGRMGVPQAAAMTYADGDAGAVSDSYASVAREIVGSRSGREMAFSTQDRAAAMGRKNKTHTKR